MLHTCHPSTIVPQRLPTFTLHSGPTFLTTTIIPHTFVYVIHSQLLQRCHTLDPSYLHVTLKAVLQQASSLMNNAHP